MWLKFLVALGDVSETVVGFVNALSTKRTLDRRGQARIAAADATPAGIFLARQDRAPTHHVYHDGAVFHDSVLELDRKGGWTLFDAQDYAFPQA